MKHSRSSGAIRASTGLRDGSRQAQATKNQNQDHIRDLIQVLREGRRELQANATAFLRDLARASQHQDAIREQGGIQLLIKSLRDGNQEVDRGSDDAQATAVALALHNLAENS